MDNLTHSLVGALLGQAGLKRRTGLAMPALIIGANVPDVDGVCMLVGTQGLALRRGLTHGPIAWLLLPLALAAILWGYDRWQEKRATRPKGRLPVRFGWLYVLALIACLTHPALDWLNSYGIRFLAPFSQRWFYGDALFIIDLWLWLGLGFATWLSVRRENRTDGNWRRPAFAALGGAVIYIGVNAMITRDAERLQLSDGPYRETIANPVPFAFWHRDLIFVSMEGRHRRIDRWSGSTEAPAQVAVFGEVPLEHCDLAAARRADKDADAFLFWSRAPFVERLPDGRWLLQDARFASRGDRFSVILPPATCRAEPAGRPS